MCSSSFPSFLSDLITVIRSCHFLIRLLFCMEMISFFVIAMNLVKHVSEGDIGIKIIITRSVCFCLFSQGFLSVCNPVAILDQVDELMNTGELAGIPSQVSPRCLGGMGLFTHSLAAST